MFKIIFQYLRSDQASVFSIVHIIKRKWTFVLVLEFQLIHMMRVKHTYSIHPIFTGASSLTELMWKFCKTAWMQLEQRF